MGKLVLTPSDFLGDAISAIGFPAGGSVGFDKIWKVNQDGFTDSLSSCNCALRSSIFKRIGGFDESFPYAGGEDSILAYNLRNANYRIKYCPDVIVYHQARNSFRDFLRWQYRRGISSYIFATKIADKGKFLSLRVWSTLNVIHCSLGHKRLPLVVFLLACGYFTQITGFLIAKYSNFKT